MKKDLYRSINVLKKKFDSNTLNKAINHLTFGMEAEKLFKDNKKI